MNAIYELNWHYLKGTAGILKLLNDVNHDPDLGRDSRNCDLISTYKLTKQEKNNVSMLLIWFIILCVYCKVN